jgi:iron complex outermembrane recepter protein
LPLPTIQGLQGVDFVEPDGSIVTDGPCGSVLGLRFDENGNPLPYCHFEDSFDFTFGNVIRRPLERWQITALSNYDISEQVEFFNELFVVNNRNEFSWAPFAGNLETQGAGRNTLLVPAYATNPIIPDPVRQLFINNPAVFDTDGDGTAEIVGAARRFGELGLRRNEFERQSIGITTGFRGDFELGDDSPWFWQTHYSFQRARTDEEARGYVSSLRLALALDAVVNPMTGEVECRNQFLGCEPANVFGVGSLSAEDADFLAPPSGDTTIVERNMFGGSISGDLFSLPAGEVAVAFGGEWREESFEFRPSAGAAGGEFGDPTPPNDGSFDVSEVFVELGVPLISDAPLAQSLVLEAAAAFSDYSTVGSVGTWRLGVNLDASELCLSTCCAKRCHQGPELE